MEYLIFIGGVIIGFIFSRILSKRERIHGVIHIDHNTDQCVINLTSEQLKDHKKKIAALYIDHNADISREEQGL